MKNLLLLLSVFSISITANAQKKAKVNACGDIVKSAKNNSKNKNITKTKKINNSQKEVVAEKPVQLKYGKDFDATTAVDVSQLATMLGEQNELKNIVAKGEITSVCQTAGCWIKVKSQNSNELFVKFGNHAFTIPTDSKGKVSFVGNLIKKTVSVEEQKHLLEDAGKSKEEIAKITAPKVEYRFMAEGLKFEQ